MSTGINLKEAEIVADNIGTSLYYDGYSKALDDLLNSLPDCDYVGIERLVCLAEQLKKGGKMKVVIDIPKDFTGDYIVDKFRDFFSRVIADIDCKGMCGRYEKEIAEMFLKAFDDSEEKVSCNCQHNSNSRDNEPCCRCDSKHTNADRIRNMSDEELADTLFNSCLEVMHIDECPYEDNVGMCKKCILDWLQSEAE